VIWLWILACAQPPVDRDGEGAAALGRLTEVGGCGDLVAFAMSEERDARLVAIATESPVQAAFAQGSPYSQQMSLAQPLGAYVFLEVGTAPLADPCAIGTPASDSEVYWPVEGFLRLTVTPFADAEEDGALGVVDVGIDSTILLSEDGVVSLEQWTASDLRVP